MSDLDPTACFRRLCGALNAKNPAAAIDACADLLAWADGGGYPEGELLDSWDWKRLAAGVEYLAQQALTAATPDVATASDSECLDGGAWCTCPIECLDDNDCCTHCLGTCAHFTPAETAETSP